MQFQAENEANSIILRFVEDPLLVNEQSKIREIVEMHIEN